MPCRCSDVQVSMSLASRHEEFYPRTYAHSQRSSACPACDLILAPFLRLRTGSSQPAYESWCDSLPFRLSFRLLLSTLALTEISLLTSNTGTCASWCLWWSGDWHTCDLPRICGRQSRYASTYKIMRPCSCRHRRSLCYDRRCGIRPGWRRRPLTDKVRCWWWRWRREGAHRITMPMLRAMLVGRWRRKLGCGCWHGCGLC